MNQNLYLNTIIGWLLFTFLLCAQQPITTNPEVTKIVSGFQFTEGPVWKAGTGLLFSDIPANTVYKWTPEQQKEIYLENSGNSNGLALDSTGHLLLAQHGLRRVVRLEKNGDQTILAYNYNGKKLNSPNDLTVKSNGTIFFTDPPYGINSGQQELGFCGIYSITSAKELKLLDTTLYRPNGIELSPDESKLYVTDSGENKIFVWEVINDSTISNKKLLASINAQGQGGTDGLKVNKKGNLFVAGPIGIWVISPQGKILDTIAVPGQTTNCAWGQGNQNHLYVTSGGNVYKINLESGAHK